MQKWAYFYWILWVLNTHIYMRYEIPVVLVKTACTGKLVFLLMYHAFWITGENVKTTATILPLQNRDACCIKFWLSKKESHCKNCTNNDSIELPGPLFSQWNIFPNLKAFLISIPIGSSLCLSLLLFLPLFSSFSSPPPSPFRSRATATPPPPPPPFLWNEKNTRPYRVF